tara:strand:+ start:82 stop:261 length:180 start_codon:yes stop_codon:yes gene_type:complete
LHKSSVWNFENSCIPVIGRARAYFVFKIFIYICIGYVAEEDSIQKTNASINLVGHTEKN